jgi:hypothetical protein
MGIYRYGCTDIEEIETFNRLYKQKLDEIVERGKISLELALEARLPKPKCKLRTHL